MVSVDENGNPDTEHNVIIFYYTEDTTHAYYKITHYTENLADAQGNTTCTNDLGRRSRFAGMRWRPLRAWLWPPCPRVWRFGGWMADA